jgi:hypothetical protein
MSIRLYESAWVDLEGHERPLQVHKDARNPAAFNVGDFQYDIDGRPLDMSVGAPKILGIYNLQAAKEAGLKADYRPSSDINI